jgi:hypothetical protein
MPIDQKAETLPDTRLPVGGSEVKEPQKSPQPEGSDGKEKEQ